MEETAPSQRGAVIAKIGAWLQALSWAIGVVGMVLASRAFNAAEYPAQFSEAVGDMTTYVMIAKTLSIFGLVLITIAIGPHRYRAAWVFYFLFFYGCMMIGFSFCLIFFTPFSSTLHFAFGLFFVCFVMSKKQDFQRAAKAAYKLPSCYQLDD